MSDLCPTCHAVLDPDEPCPYEVAVPVIVEVTAQAAMEFARQRNWRLVRSEADTGPIRWRGVRAIYLETDS